MSTHRFGPKSEKEWVQGRTNLLFRGLHRAPPSKHLHAEAFCLMKYATDDRSVVEWIWNSRDGVTPLCIMTRDREHEMTHVNWNEDTYAPDHRPQAGDRIFVDMTLDRARALAREVLAMYSDTIPEDCREGAAFDEFVERVAQGYFGDGHRPTLIVVIDPSNYDGSRT